MTWASEPAQGQVAVDARAGQAGEATAIGLGGQFEDRGPLAGDTDDGECRHPGGRFGHHPKVAVAPVPSVPVLRVGMFSPYSLTIPGGVQNQVMGLARALRGDGHRGARARAVRRPAAGDVRHAAGQQPADGGQRFDRPARPGPVRALRTIRALRDEQFDVLHLHEPFAPGPTMTALVVHPAPDRGHVPRGRWQQELRAARPADPLVGRRRRLPRRRRVRGRPAAGAHCSARRRVRGAVQRGRARPLPQRRAVADGRPDDLLLRPPRGAQGPRRAARGRCRSSAPTCACGWPAAGRTRSGCAPRTATTPASSGSGRSPTRRRSAASAGPTCSARRRCAASRSGWC